jgi:Ethylbenzene dehydrogenase/Cytochrome c554 and c-prime
MKQKQALIVGFIAIGIMLVSMACERTVTNEITKTVTPATASYMGSSSCGSAGCHESQYADFMNTGHPYKLNEAEDAQQPGYYPYSSVPTPPPGVNWADVDKVIGGFRWKARFIDNNGFIITGDQVQYNLETQGWVGYHSGETKPYDCGPCHMTNYKPVGNQESKPGLVGTWEANGVQCEECHGPGEAHEADPLNVAMKIDRSNESCGKCHIRGDANLIPAKGGFVRHHEQWNEMYSTKHSSIQCVDCHDVHKSLHPNNPDRDQAINLKCENCHFKEYAQYQDSPIASHVNSAAGPDCIDCHMAKAAKSAVGDTLIYSGDVASHMFRINTDPDAEMFTPDGKFANGYLTLEYSCLQCHSGKDKAWAANFAHSIHPAPGDVALGPDLDVLNSGSAPIIDGSIDGIWSGASPTIVKAGLNPGFAVSFGQVDVTMRSIVSNNILYLLAEWTDPSATKSVNKKRWSFSSGQWAAGSEDEDRFYVMFDAGDNGDEKATCATMCHKPVSDNMGTTGGGHVDVWHWKAARTNPGNHADDKWWDSTGRGSDSKTSSMYSNNRQDIGGGVLIPKYMHTSGTAYTGDFLFAEDTVAFDSLLDWTGKTLPYYYIDSTASGSRWDVMAKGVYSSGKWTLELARPLNTGNVDDVVLGSGQTQVTIAITDNSGHEHSGSVPFNLVF